MSTANHDDARNLAHYIIASDHGNEDALPLARAYIERCEQVRELESIIERIQVTGGSIPDQCLDMQIKCDPTGLQVAGPFKDYIARILGAEDAS